MSQVEFEFMASDWKFKDPKNHRVYTLRQIMDDGAPILHVSHNSDDGAWQFLGWEAPKVEDGIVVCLEHIVEKDPSVVELVDLPLGWHAWRERLTEPWITEVDPDDREVDDGSATY